MSPPPSDERRQDRTDIRIGIFDATPRLRFTIVECFPPRPASPGLRDPGASLPGLAVEGRDQRRHRTRAHRSGPGHRVRVLRLCRQRHRRAHGAVVKDASDSSELPREAMQRVLNNSVYTLLSRETRALRGVAAVDWGLRTEDALLYRIGKFGTGGGSRCQLADLAGARRHLTRPRVSLKGTDGYP